MACAWVRNPPARKQKSTGPAPIFKDRQDHAFPVIPSAAEGSAELSTRISPLASPGRNDRPVPTEQQGPSGPHRSVSEASGRKPKQLPAVRGLQEPENKGKRFLHTPDYLDAGDRLENKEERFLHTPDYLDAEPVVRT